MGGWRRVWGGGTGLQSKVWRKEILQIIGKMVKVKVVAGQVGGLKGRGRPADCEELEGRVRGEE